MPPLAPPVPPAAQPPVISTCAAQPNITCGSVPTCTTPGESVLLLGTCVANASGAGVMYIVNNHLATHATCPAAGVVAPVLVVPVFPSHPECCYNASLGFNLSSERHAPMRRWPSDRLREWDGTTHVGQGCIPPSHPSPLQPCSSILTLCYVLPPQRGAALQRARPRPASPAPTCLSVGQLVTRCSWRAAVIPATPLLWWCTR